MEVQTTRLQALLQQKDVLVNKKENVENFIGDFQSKLFKEEEMAFLLGRISKLVMDSNVELLSSRPMEQSEAFPEPYSEKYKKYLSLITISGGFHEIADFVSRIESYEQHLQIQSLTIVPKSNAQGKQVADIKLMGVSHAGGNHA